MDAATIIRRARVDSGLTLRALAALAGTSDATLSAYEQGRVTPRVDTLARIVEAAGVRLEPVLARAPERDPRQGTPGEVLWDVLLLADALPQRERHQRAPRPQAVLRPAEPRP